MSKEYQDIDGIRFRRYSNAANASDRTYFHCIDRNGKKIYAHRYVWERANGPIPHGWHVHHKDKDTSNNTPENLEAMPASEHFALHAAEPKNYTDLVGRMNHARIFASEWHKSDAGRKRHKEIGFVAWKDFKPVAITCDNCETEFMSINLNCVERFCSNSCKSAWRRKSGVDDVVKACEVCGCNYSSNKYAKRRSCSRKCGVQLRKKAPN